MYKIMAIKIEPRNTLAPKVQEILTEYGDIIMTRLGVNENFTGKYSNTGLIILSLEESKTESIKNLHYNLENIDGVKTKFIEL